MAHEISFVNGVAQYASTQQEWHFFETKHNIILPTDTQEEILRKCGMDYKIKKAFVRYATAALSPDTPAHALNTMKDKIVLFRSDTGAALGVVSDTYKVVQPEEVIATIMDFAALEGLTLESAGVLFNGRKYFATGKIANAVVEAVDGTGGKDKVIPYLLMHSTADGSGRTEARWTGVRTVCNNTLRAALSSASCFSLSHRSTFRRHEAQGVAEQAHKEFGAYMETARKLATIRCTQKDAEDFTRLLLMPSTRPSAVTPIPVAASPVQVPDSDKVRESYGYRSIMALFNGAGKGSMLETARETQWGWLNAVTQHYDHETRARTEDARIANALWGTGDDMKQKAYALLTQ